MWLCGSRRDTPGNVVTESNFRTQVFWMHFPAEQIRSAQQAAFCCYRAERGWVAFRPPNVELEGAEPWAVPTAVPIPGPRPRSSPARFSLGSADGEDHRRDYQQCSHSPSRTPGSCRCSRHKSLPSTACLRSAIWGHTQDQASPLAALTPRLPKETNAVKAQETGSPSKGRRWLGGTQVRRLPSSSGAGRG